MSHVQDVFRCARCGGEFPKGWSDEESLAEAGRDPFGFQTPPENDPFDGEMATICDNCYQEIAVWVVAHGGIENAMACATDKTIKCPHR